MNTNNLAVYTCAHVLWLSLPRHVKRATKNTIDVMFLIKTHTQKIVMPYNKK
jgi:hypothetical protein